MNSFLSDFKWRRYINHAALCNLYFLNWPIVLARLNAFDFLYYILQKKKKDQESFEISKRKCLLTQNNKVHWSTK